MATLLEAAGRATYRCDFEFDDECLKKKVIKMPARDPYLCSHLQEKAEQYIVLGNNAWPSRDDLDQVAMDVANQLSEDVPSGTELF
jgi:hypothetical protein